MFQNTPINLVITIYCMKLYSRPQSITLNYTVVHSQSYEAIKSSTNNHMFTFLNYSSGIFSFPFPITNAETLTLHLLSNTL